MLELQCWADKKGLDGAARSVESVGTQQKAEMGQQEILDHSQLTSFQREEVKDWNLDRARRKAQKEKELYRRIVEKGEIPQESPRNKRNAQ